VEGHEQEQEREPDDAGYEQRHAVGDVLALVLERRRHPADLGGDAGRREFVGHHLVAQPVDQLLGLLVLR
jgi:hypothetical protein